MSEKGSDNFKRQLIKAGAIGGVMGAIDFGATTDWMHRSLTHKAYKPVKPLELAARTVIWGTGTRPRVWATVHRDHHHFADVPGDPHSPVLQGRFGVAKLIVKNTPLYSRAARKVEKANVFAPDLQPDELDRKFFDKTKRGLKTSLVGHMALNKAMGNPSYMGGASWTVEKFVYIMGGNLVNGLGHAGKHPFKALLTGKIEPHADGTVGADTVAVSLLTLGEGNQKYHHEHPESLFFGADPEDMSWPARAIKDLGGTAAMALVKMGLAEMGAEPMAEAAQKLIPSST
jgi:stearoyl-CoA desaturase (Delta-9 desaturase)